MNGNAGSEDMYTIIPPSNAKFLKKWLSQFIFSLTVYKHRDIFTVPMATGVLCIFLYYHAVQVQFYVCEWFCQIAPH